MSRTKTHKQITLTLSHQSVAEIEKRKGADTTSSIVDRDLSRYYSLLEANREKIVSMFDRETLLEIKTAMDSQKPFMRNMGVTMLQSCLFDTGRKNGLDGAALKKFQKLSFEEVVALIDTVESLEDAPQV